MQRIDHPGRLWCGLLGAVALAAALLAPAAAHAQIGTHSFKLSAGDPEDAPGPVATRRFAELVAQKSGDRIRIRTFHSAVLGGDVQMHGALQGGTVDFALVGAPTLVGMVKEFGVLDFPFTYRDARELDALLDGPMGHKLLERLQDRDLVGLGFWEIGFRNVTNSKRPITRWEDLSGLKIRTVQSPVFREFFSALGANAVPMPINEVFSALETRAIDAQENPVSIVASQRFDEVQRYLSLTGHIYTAYVLLASGKTWERLSDEERRLIVEAADEARGFQRTLARQQNEALLEQLGQRGMQINTPSEGELARFADKAAAVRSRFAADIGQPFVTEWLAELDRIRQPR
jgi:tripartite ATP-independent transporter DctP family solute receptor